MTRPLTSPQSTSHASSALRQWPVQLQLVQSKAAFLQQAHLLIAADCTPFAYADFHRDFIAGRVLVNACPKLDDCTPYVDKLAAIISENDIQSITVTVMEVPCCRGLVGLAQQAMEKADRTIPCETVIIGIDGLRKDEFITKKPDFMKFER